MVAGYGEEGCEAESLPQLQTGAEQPPGEPSATPCTALLQWEAASVQAMLDVRVLPVCGCATAGH